MAAHLLHFSTGVHHENHHYRRTNPNPTHRLLPLPNPCTTHSFSLHLRRSSSASHSLRVYASGGDGGNSGRGIGGSGGGGDGDDDSDRPNSADPVGIFLNGWRSRVKADPEFPFKVLMEELVGVSSCLLGDMASRPNWGLNELDFVFSTLVVGSILNFTLMYLLAPTATSTALALPGIFARCPVGHMFESGSYSALDRAGTLVYKGAVFAAVGFAAGLVGTALSNGLIGLRKKMDPEFEPPNKPPPTLLNSLTWAAHMGVSSNVRYQTLNGLEFLLAKVLPPAVFKANVVVLRCLNNVLGGMSFVVLARMTGSQKAGSAGQEKEEMLITGKVAAVVAENGDGELQGNGAQSIRSGK